MNTFKQDLVLKINSFTPSLKEANSCRASDREFPCCRTVHGHGIPWPYDAAQSRRKYLWFYAGRTCL